MRIGIDARLWSESGVGRYIRNLVLQLQEIDKKNEYVLFVLNRNLKEVLHCVQNDNFKVVDANIRWHTLEEQIKFPSILHKEKLDLVHFPYFSVPIFYQKTFVVTIHDLILHHFPTGQASTLPLPFYWCKLCGYKFVMQQAARKAQKIITVSNATKDEIIDHLYINKHKIVVTYEGVDKHIACSKWHIEKNDKRSAISDKQYFLYIGNAYPHKNLERLIEAFSKLEHQNSKTKLILVGKEDFFYKRLKEKVSAMRLDVSVQFYGEATDEELSGLYMHALALVMPSLMEGFGLPVLEAMANRCLVLASDIPVHHEIAGEAAIYFNPNYSDDLVEKLKVISSNGKNYYNKKIEEGLGVSKKFSWQKMAKETLSVYESSFSL